MTLEEFLAGARHYQRGIAVVLGIAGLYIVAYAIVVVGCATP